MKWLWFFCLLFLTACTVEKIPTLLDAEVCTTSGGNWNECGSPCTGEGVDFCIEVCEAQCQCGGIAGFACPGGYQCRLSGKIADEMGKCIIL